MKSALYPASENAQCAYNYKNYKLNMNGITFPTPLSQIPKVEKQNNIVINVYGYEKGDIVPYYVSRISRSYAPRIKLLYLTPPYKSKHVNDVEDFEIDDDYDSDCEDEDPNLPSGHYCWIKNMTSSSRTTTNTNVKSSYAKDVSSSS